MWFLPHDTVLSAQQHDISSLFNAVFHFFKIVGLRQRTDSEKMLRHREQQQRSLDHQDDDDDDVDEDELSDQHRRHHSASKSGSPSLLPRSRNSTQSRNSSMQSKSSLKSSSTTAETSPDLSASSAHSRRKNLSRSAKKWVRVRRSYRPVEYQVHSYLHTYT